MVAACAAAVPQVVEQVERLLCRRQRAPAAGGQSARRSCLPPATARLSLEVHAALSHRVGVLARVGPRRENPDGCQSAAGWSLQVARGRAIIPANKRHVELEPCGAWEGGREGARQGGARPESAGFATNSR